MRKIYISFIAAFIFSANVFAATYTVTNTNDAGAGSLRQAITDANTLTPATADIINFTTSGILVLASNLPALTDNAGVTINGNTATGYVANTNLTGALNGTLTFTIDGNNLYSAGITISSDNNIIRGLNFINVGTAAGTADAMININAGADNNQVLGCYIGTDVNGTASSAVNTEYGFYLNGANNQIGGTTADRNLISGIGSGVGASGVGIRIIGASATGNTVKGNIIGLQKDGATYLAITQYSGLMIGSFPVATVGNTIGGTAAGEGNVISGNIFTGISFPSAGAGNTVLGNIIGPQADGTSNVASNTQDYGIYVNTSTNNIIGGSAAGARNIISANTSGGIWITAAAATGNTIKGNYIGLDITGTTFIAGSSQGAGITISSSSASNTIGGTGAGEGNVVSGNTSYGFYTSSTAVAGNSILGNIIGPQANGTSNVAANSQDYGIYITGSPNNTIGGSSAGARNIISANLDYGIYITGAGSTGNLMKGNYIGLDQNGTTFIAGSSQDYGVYISAAAASNTIGGTGAGEGNVISGNKVTTYGYGVYITSTAVAGNSILGNIIGPQANGTSYVLSNVQNFGIYIFSPNNIIGGNTAGARNVISANEDNGIFIQGAVSTGNIIKGNYIGIDKNGTTFIAGSSQDYGVLIDVSAGGTNIIGGTAAGEGNVISGNKGGATGFGVTLSSSAAAGNSVIGNIIGPQANGTSYITSNAQTYGISIFSSPNNVIGGNSAGARNIISANESGGIQIGNAGSTGNVVQGNYIGPSSALASIGSSSQDYGVYISSSAANNTIGGSVAGEANTIAFNTVNGVYLTGAATDFNLISRNPIYSNNNTKPINLNYTTGVNNDKWYPAITTANTTTIGGTSGAGDIVEVFKNSTGNCNDAVTFVGAATANGAGNWSLAVALAASDYVFATATDGSNNTSEFNPCVVSLPVELFDFSANCKAPSDSPKKGEVVLNWTTASETNNNFFTIERSLSPSGGGTGGGLAFAQIGTVKGAGNSSTIRKYEFIDGQLETLNLKPETILYYRLRQTDFNGTAETFSPVSVSCSGTSGFSFSVYPNPVSEGNIYVSVNGAADENVLVVITDVLGRELYSKIIIEQSDGYLFNINLQDKIAPGVYLITVSANNKYFSKKIVVK